MPPIFQRRWRHQACVHVNIPATALVWALTVFREYDARSGSSSVGYRTVNYRRNEQIKRRTPPIVGDITTKNWDPTSGHLHVQSLRNHTEINAHSPLYSVKIGRVVLMNAGAANTAMAIPTFTAYLVSGSLNRSPITQSVCLTFPQKVRVDLFGVSTVSGACGRILGK